jgi:digeranylgeranylglycerophospholipid reductase
MNVYDVAVIGAGPSGLYAAKLLADEGLHVVVLEKKGEIGTDVICTGIVGKELFREFSLPADSVVRDIQTVNVRMSSGQTLTYRHPAAFAAIVNRRTFDQNVTKEAQKAGVEIELGCRVSDIFIDKEAVRITAKKAAKSPKKISARMAVLATGNDYRLNKKAGLGCPKDFLLGVQVEIPAADGDIPTVFIGKDIAPGGFAWSVPAGDRDKIGLVTKAEPRTCFRSFLRRFYPEIERSFPSQGLKVKAIAQGLISRSYGERVLILGEAAGQVKTTTGGGIYYGLHCSRIAAEVILKAYHQGSFQAPRLAEYERSWKHALRREILVGYYARKLYARMSERHVEKLFALAQTDGIIPLIQEKANFDWQSDLILDLMTRAPVFRILHRILKSPSVLKKHLS